jgi:hypothetical protein
MPPAFPDARPERSTEATSSTSLALATNNLDIEIETPALAPARPAAPEAPISDTSSTTNPDPEIEAPALAPRAAGLPRSLDHQPHPREQSVRPKSQGKSGVESAAGQLMKEERQEMSAFSSDWSHSPAPAPRASSPRGPGASALFPVSSADSLSAGPGGHWPRRVARSGPREIAEPHQLDQLARQARPTISPGTGEPPRGRGV